MNSQKINGVVYTPDWLVRLILDRAGFDGRRGSVVDPACGDGAFLAEAVRRIVAAGGDKNALRRRLENDVAGADIDAAAIAACRARLSGIAAAAGVHDVRWRLHCQDALQREFAEGWRGRFDFVVGNPPYIRIQNMGVERRERIKQEWRFCRHGSADIYLAFFELGLQLLAAGGALGFISPNTWLKTHAAKTMRQWFKRERVVEALIDFGHHQLFEGLTTYCVIAILRAGKQDDRFALLTGDGKTAPVYVGELRAAMMDDDNWVLCSPARHAELRRMKQNAVPLRDVADIHVGITTLADKCYIFQNPAWQGETALVTSPLGGVAEVEKGLLRPIVKASLLKADGKNQNRFVLFPYRLENGRHKIISEEELAAMYPLAYRYLRGVRPLLDQRDRGKPNAVAWYAFGRSQGLDTSFGGKILTSPMNARPNFIVWEQPEYTFYSGYCIKTKAPRAGELHRLCGLLNSRRMENYIDMVSRRYQNDYKSFAKSFLAEFPLPQEAGERRAKPANLRLAASL